VFYLDNKIGRFWWQTNSADFCMTDDRFFWPILLADETGQHYRSSDSCLRLSLSENSVTDQSYGSAKVSAKSLQRLKSGPRLNLSLAKAWADDHIKKVKAIKLSLAKYESLSLPLC